MFCEVIGFVGFAWSPVYYELFLSDSVLYKLMSYFKDITYGLVLIYIRYILGFETPTSLDWQTKNYQRDCAMEHNFRFIHHIEIGVQGLKPTTLHYLIKTRHCLHHYLFQHNNATDQVVGGMSKFLILQKAMRSVTSEHCLHCKWVSTPTLEKAIRLRYNFGDHFDFSRASLSKALGKIHG